MYCLSKLRKLAFVIFAGVFQDLAKECASAALLFIHPDKYFMDDRQTGRHNTWRFNGTSWGLVALYIYFHPHNPPRAPTLIFLPSSPQSSSSLSFVVVAFLCPVLAFSCVVVVGRGGIRTHQEVEIAPQPERFTKGHEEWRWNFWHGNGFKMDKQK